MLAVHRFSKLALATFLLLNLDGMMTKPPLQTPTDQTATASAWAIPMIGTAQAAEPNQSATLPVKTVALFTSGVGYFQHAGSVPGGSAIQLLFGSNQINDLLKSLVLEDLDGGQPGFVEYPSRDPLSKILDEFQVNLGGDPTLAEILKQLRGAQVTVDYQGENLEGTILGVEERPVAVNKKDEPINDWVINLVHGGRIRALPLRDIRHLELSNPTLRDELANALTTLDQGRGKDKKPVTLRFSGSGQRKVRIGYVVEAPVWKSSYRLILDEKDGTGRIQGWAIVENQTDHDWENIRLSLISGRPISFTQDLYQPLYAPRPEVKPRLHASIRPRLYESGISREDGEDQASGGSRAKAKRAMPMAAAPPPPAPAMRQMAPGMAMAAEHERAASAEENWEKNEMHPDGVMAMATAGEVGALFRFVVDGISLPRRRSAMIPIVADPIRLEKVSIYNQQTLANHPLLGVALENTTGKHLPAGPVTLFDSGSYAGDGQVDDLPPGWKRLLSFAVDQELKVLVNPERSESQIIAGKIVKGVMILTHKRQSSRIYTLENTGTASKTIILEHPVRADWKLTEPTKPMETTPTVHRFKQVVAPGKILPVTVAEEQVQRQDVVLAKSSAANLLYYVRDDTLTKPIREKLQQAVTLQQALEDTRRHLTDLDRQIKSLQQEQDRIRENIKALNPGSQHHDQMVRKLMEREGLIDKRQIEMDGLRKTLESQQEKLDEFLKGLNLD